jgi:hypothetical protein
MRGQERGYTDHYRDQRDYKGEGGDYFSEKDKEQKQGDNFEAPANQNNQKKKKKQGEVAEE